MLPDSAVSGQWRDELWCSAWQLVSSSAAPEGGAAGAEGAEGAERAAAGAGGTPGRTGGCRTDCTVAAGLGAGRPNNEYSARAGICAG